MMMRTLAITACPVPELRAGADFLLSVMYQTGYLVPRNIHRAWGLCRRAATKGYIQAQMTLKTIVERSDSSNPFFQSSLDWFVHADNCVVPEGWHQAAVRLTMEATENNHDQIILLYKRASRCGYLPSINNLGLHLAQQGRYKEAYRHLERAASGGYRLAQFNLLLMHFDGTAPDCNVIASFKLLEQLAFAKFAPAQYKLAELYLTGCFVRKNDRLAYKYFSLAAEQGYMAARLALVQMQLDTDGLFYDESRAFGDCVKLAMKADADAEAQFLMAQLFFFGRGTRRDFDAALFWCTVAANNGLEAARTWLIRNYESARN